MPVEYPAARDRGRVAPGSLAEAYERIESTEAEAASTDTMTTAITFSGWVDAVVLTARTAGIRFRLTDRLGLQSHDVAVIANDQVQLRVACERVMIQSLVAATPGSAFITGLYARPAEKV